MIKCYLEEVISTFSKLFLFNLFTNTPGCLAALDLITYRSITFIESKNSIQSFLIIADRFNPFQDSALVK
jgi:hypothetical protein